MTDLPPFLAPVEPERERAPYTMGSHGGPAEVFRFATLDALWQAQEALAALTDAIRARPDDDVTTNSCIKLFDVAQDQAGEALVRFRNARECAGMG